MSPDPTDRLRECGPGFLAGFLRAERWVELDPKTTRLFDPYSPSRIVTEYLSRLQPANPPKHGPSSHGVSGSKELGYADWVEGSSNDPCQGPGEAAEQQSLSIFHKVERKSAAPLRVDGKSRSVGLEKRDVAHSRSLQSVQDLCDRLMLRRLCTN
jgi:hypothetical protein